MKAVKTPFIKVAENCNPYGGSNSGRKFKTVVKMLLESIKHHEDIKLLSMAVDDYVLLAENYENGPQYKGKVIEYYEKAVEMYKKEDMKVDVLQYLSKIGYLSAELGDFQKALKIFTQVVEENDSPSFGYTVNNTILKVLICSLNINFVGFSINLSFSIVFHISKLIFVGFLKIYFLSY